MGYGLTDSPALQAAWVYEKLHAWSDHDEEGSPFSNDEILDTVMLYWLPATGASAARLYWESMADAMLSKTVDLPIGVSIMSHDTTRAPRAWAERYLRKIIHWNEPARGGHFAALEQPASFIDEVRTCFRPIR